MTVDPPRAPRLLIRADAGTGIGGWPRDPCLALAQALGRLRRFSRPNNRRDAGTLASTVSQGRRRDDGTRGGAAWGSSAVQEPVGQLGSWRCQRCLRHTSRVGRPKHARSINSTAGRSFTHTGQHSAGTPGVARRARRARREARRPPCRCPAPAPAVQQAARTGA